MAHHYQDIERLLGVRQQPQDERARYRRTSRKPKTTRVPRTRAGGEWTEAAFWQFLRSALRQSSRRWPPITRLVWHHARRPYVGPDSRRKWEFQCAICQGWHKQTDMHVDHIIPCGTLKSWDDLAGFAERLFCETENLQILCTDCHRQK